MVPMHTCPACARAVVIDGSACPACGVSGPVVQRSFGGVALALALVGGLLGCQELYGVAVSDADGDGYFAGDDCDDGDPEVNPAAIEDPANGVDDDCDGEIDESEG